MNDDRHILVMNDGTEWLRDPRFDGEQRLKDMPQDMANEFRKELPIRRESEAGGWIPAIAHIFMDELLEDWDGSEDDPTSRFLIPLELHVHHGDTESVTNVHLYGIAVHQDDDSIQQVDDDEFAEDLDLLTGITNPDHPFYTVKLDNGRDYVVFGVPYC